MHVCANCAARLLPFARIIRFSVGLMNLFTCLRRGRGLPSPPHQFLHLVSGPVEQSPRMALPVAPLPASPGLRVAALALLGDTSLPVPVETLHPATCAGAAA